MSKKGFTIHIDEDIIDDFRTYCNLNALKVSAKVELLLKKELKNAKINPTLVEMFEKILDGQKILRAQKSSEQTRVTESESEKRITNVEQIRSRNKRKKKVPTIEHLKRMKSI